MQNELAAAQEELASSYLEVEHLQDELRSTNATGGCSFFITGAVHCYGSSWCTCRTSCAPPMPPAGAAWLQQGGITRKAACTSMHSQHDRLTSPSLLFGLRLQPTAVKSLFADVHSIKNKVFQERQERAAAAAAPSVPAVLQSLDQATRECSCRGLHAG